MSIVTIFRGSYRQSKEVAEKLANKLGYECISREMILEAAAKHFDIPEFRLTRAIDDAPSLLDRLTYGKEKFIAYFREMLMHHLIKDNVVYHGLVGHLFLQKVTHVLTVSILADRKDRLAEEKIRGLSPKEALAIIEKDDEALSRWGNFVYGIDVRDPRLYDLVIRLRFLTTDDAVGLIQSVLEHPCFKTTSESQKAMETWLHASQVQTVLMKEIPSAKVGVERGEIVVTIGGSWAEGKKLIAKVDQIIDNERGVKVKVSLTSP